MTSPQHEQPDTLTIFHVVFALIVVVCATGGYIVGRVYGWLYVVPGIVLGVGVARALLYCFFAIVSLWYPPLPNCRMCRKFCYKDLERSPSETTYICEVCNARYIDSDDKLFQQIMPDGSLQPYKKRRDFGGWRDDN